MINIQDIKNFSKPHPVHSGARMTKIQTGPLIISIVGGARGLYGDFEEDFEVAVIDTETDGFVTRFFYPEGNDDVVPYLSAEKTEDFVNNIVKDSFQVL